MVALRSGRRSVNVELRNINTIGPCDDGQEDNPAPVERSKLILFYRWKPGCDLKDHISAHALDSCLSGTLFAPLFRWLPGKMDKMGYWNVSRTHLPQADFWTESDSKHENVSSDLPVI